MAASYSEASQKGSVPTDSILARIAAELRAKTTPCRLSPLVFMTDSKRMEDPIDIVSRLPKGCAVIYRHFGDPKQAEGLRMITREQDRQFLIGNDPELAENISADGVHFARDANLGAPIKWRKKHPDWIITMAGLKTGAYLAPLSHLDALFISSIFPSRSPSAGDAIGVAALTERTARLPMPIYALGGVDAGTAPQLMMSGAAGLAAIEGLIMDVQKQDTKAGHRFVIKTKAGEAELTLAKVRAKNGHDVFNANHTFTPPALRGQGVAGKLYVAMVADAKLEGYKIIPGCPYIEVKFKRNPEGREAVGVKA